MEEMIRDFPFNDSRTKATARHGTKIRPKYPKSRATLIIGHNSITQAALMIRNLSNLCVSFSFLSSRGPSSRIASHAANFIGINDVKTPCCSPFRTPRVSTRVRARSIFTAMQFSLLPSAAPLRASGAEINFSEVKEKGTREEDQRRQFEMDNLNLPPARLARLSRVRLLARASRGVGGREETRLRGM